MQADHRGNDGLSDAEDSRQSAPGAAVEDSWSSGGAYEYFMGRWSRPVAREFVNWLSPPAGLRWVDIGCGSGALSEAIIDLAKPARITAIDRSKEFVREARRRLGSRAHCQTGDALALPTDKASVDFAVSGLVLNFIPDRAAALAEMRRVCVPGGTVAVYVWDYSGKMEFLNVFWDAAVAIDPNAAALREGRRFPDSTADSLTGLFHAGGLADVEAFPIDISTYFRDFDDFWLPFLGGQGPAPTYLLSLDESIRQTIREHLAEQLPVRPDGSILLEARAWAVRGAVGH